MVNGTPGGTRTPDARLRTPPLYPTELQGQGGEWWRLRDYLPRPCQAPLTTTSIVIIARRFRHQPPANARNLDGGRQKERQSVLAHHHGLKIIGSFPLPTSNPAGCGRGCQKYADVGMPQPFGHHDDVLTGLESNRGTVVWKLAQAARGEVGMAYLLAHPAVRPVPQQDSLVRRYARSRSTSASSRRRSAWVLVPCTVMVRRRGGCFRRPCPG